MATKDNLFWKGRRLYYKHTSKLIEMEPKKEPLMEIAPDKVNLGLWYVEWPDGVRSVSSYNIDRAKDFCSVIALATLNKEEVNTEI